MWTTPTNWTTPLPRRRRSWTTLRCGNVPRESAMMSARPLAARQSGQGRHLGFAPSPTVPTFPHRARRSCLPSARGYVDLSMRVTRRSEASLSCWSSARLNASITSERTVATCAGAFATSFAWPALVRIVLVKRPSVGSGSRRTRPRDSSRSAELAVALELPTRRTRRSGSRAGAPRSCPAAAR